MCPLSQTQHLFFFRKPAGVPSTRGKEHCFLDDVAYWLLEQDTFAGDFPHFVDAFEAIQTMIGAVWGDMHVARQFLVEEFSVWEEYGLLHRLDTDTSWWLYFARSRDIYQQRRGWQKANNIEKYYLAQVHGDIARQRRDDNDPWVRTWDDATIVLSFPMMHHRFDTTRMVSCRTPESIDKLRRQGTGKLLDAQSTVHFLSYDKERDMSIVRVKLYHGRRHQIRIHLATYWYPLVWDSLYGKSSGLLQLVSAWCSFSE